MVGFYLVLICIIMVMVVKIFLEIIIVLVRQTFGIIVYLLHILHNCDMLSVFDNSNTLFLHEK